MADERTHKIRRSTRRLTGVIALVAAFATASVASAVVYVYSNNFGSGADYREIDQTGGGNDCDDSYGKGSKAMRVEVGADVFCEYSPPVTGDAEAPDHEVVAVGRVLSSTPKNARKRAYLGVRVRVGGGTYYEFRVFPKGGKYQLSRNPSGGASGLPLKDESNEIKGLGSKNKLRLAINGSAVEAFVNNQSVATYADPNPGQVKGKTVSFGAGSTKDARNGPIASFSQVRVGIPNP